jgi:hypothetical protein
MPWWRVLSKEVFDLIEFLLVLRSQLFILDRVPL